MFHIEVVLDFLCGLTAASILPLTASVVAPESLLFTHPDSESSEKALVWRRKGFNATLQHLYPFLPFE